MNPDQIDLVQATYEQLLPMADELAGRFYARLFERAPELRPLFPADMAGQRHKLIGTIDAVVVALWRIEVLSPALAALGGRHVAYGARPEHYAVVGDALVDAVGESLGPVHTPAVAAAWRAAYDLVAAAMLAGAAQVQ